MSDINKFSLLSQPETKLVFDQVFQNRTIRVRDLIRQVPSISHEAAMSNLGKLERAKLVSKKDAASASFTVYYVTPDGLEASRKMRQISDW